MGGLTHICSQSRFELAAHLLYDLHVCNYAFEFRFSARDGDMTMQSEG